MSNYDSILHLLHRSLLAPVGPHFRPQKNVNRSSESGAETSLQDLPQRPWRAFSFAPETEVLDHYPENIQRNMIIMAKLDTIQ